MPHGQPHMHLVFLDPAHVQASPGHVQVTRLRNTQLIVCLRAIFELRLPGWMGMRSFFCLALFAQLN